MPEDESEPKIINDKRVDEMGFIAELVKNHSDELKTQLKVRATSEGAKIIEGEHFRAVLAGGTSSGIDPKKFFKLIEAGKLTEKQFLGCISVSSTAAKEFLSGVEIARISDEVQRSPSLTVSRKKGFVPTIVDAIKAISKSLLDAA